VNEILVCFMYNAVVIALWMSYILMFWIVSLLKFNNNQTGYISKVIESNLVNFNNIHDVQNFFNNSSSSSSSISNSSSETVNEQVKRIKN
jgi:hypothetical protein